jgi:hypothetical protein
MAIVQGRFCIFCGKKPNDKTREHVLPYWLLELTGDPTRVVTFGQDFSKDKKPIRYSWSNYVAPACALCNNKYSKLESSVKPKVEALQRREALSVADYVELLDWLDKVRVGVWFVRHMIEKHPSQISPNFHIDSRIAQKDRMVAVYVFDGHSKGINLLGAESMIFNDMPSCFGLRINEILLLNISCDFFCSAGCGFPFPATMKLQIGGPEGGKMVLQNFQYPTETQQPITKLRLFKPVVWLYQPIPLTSTNPTFQGGFLGHFNKFDSRLASLMLEGSDRQGALFRQFSDNVKVQRGLSESIEFDEVMGAATSLLKDVAASIYDAQRFVFGAVKHERHGPAEEKKFQKAYHNLVINHAKDLAQRYRSWRPSRDGH